MASRPAYPSWPLLRSLLVVCVLVLCLPSAALAETAWVSGIAWRDMNQDGVLDKDEPAIEGALVVLSDLDGAVIDQTTTGADGRYALDAPQAGRYAVTYRTPIMITTLAPVYVVLENDAPGHVVDFPGEVYLPGCCPMMQGTIWHDVDADGEIDLDEDVLPDVAVRLYTQSGDLAGVTVSDAEGTYGIEMSWPSRQGYVFIDAQQPYTRGVAPLYWATDFTACFRASADVGLVTAKAPTGHLAPSGSATASPAMLPPSSGRLTATAILADSGAPVSGVRFSLYDERGELFGEATSDAEGVVRFVELVSYANYVLRQAPRADLRPLTSHDWGIASITYSEIDLRLPQESVPNALPFRAYGPLIRLSD